MEELPSFGDLSAHDPAKTDAYINLRPEYLELPNFGSLNAATKSNFLARDMKLKTNSKYIIIHYIDDREVKTRLVDIFDWTGKHINQAKFAACQSLEWDSPHAFYIDDGEHIYKYDIEMDLRAILPKHPHYIEARGEVCELRRFNIHAFDHDYLVYFNSAPRIELNPDKSVDVYARGIVHHVRNGMKTAELLYLDPADKVKFNFAADYAYYLSAETLIIYKLNNTSDLPVDTYIGVTCAVWNVNTLAIGFTSGRIILFNPSLSTREVAKFSEPIKDLAWGEGRLCAREGDRFEIVQL